MSRNLAWAFDGLMVREAAREYLKDTNGHYDEQDLALIWEAQKNSEDKARKSNASFLFCDTGPAVIHLWARFKYKLDIPSVSAAVAERPYDLVLLCQPDLPWQPDPQRETPDPGQRKQLFAEYRKIYAARNLKIISGYNRLETAFLAVEQVLRLAINSRDHC